MKRLVVSAILALGLHAILFWTEVPWTTPRLVLPSSRAVNIELVALQKPRPQKPLPTSKIEVDQPKPNRPSQTPLKPKLKPKPAVKQKRRSKPKPAAKPKVVPKPLAKAIVSPELDAPQANVSTAPVPATPDRARQSEMSETAPALRLPETDAIAPIAENSETAEVVASIPLYHLNPPPRYPRMARKRSYQGLVLLDVRVSDEGLAEEVLVAQSSGYAILDRSAVKTVKRWRFAPARRGDQPIEMWVKVPVRFELR